MKMSRLNELWRATLPEEEIVVLIDRDSFLELCAECYSVRRQVNSDDSPPLYMREVSIGQMTNTVSPHGIVTVKPRKE